VVARLPNSGPEAVLIMVSNPVDVMTYAAMPHERVRTRTVIEPERSSIAIVNRSLLSNGN